MKLSVLTAMVAVILLTAPNVRTQTAQTSHFRNGLIAHIEHDGLSFSIRIDPANDQSLAINIPQKTGSYAWSSLPPVHLKVLMRGTENPIEGSAELIHGAVSMGGSDQIRYRFPLPSHVVVDDIQSVTISIGDQTYSVFTF
jgi:hypothetical protein